MKCDPADKPDIPVSKRRFRVWKTKAWKRRSQMRAAKAQAYRSLADQD